MIALGVALALLVGVSLGLLGGGGSILTVPILLYVIGMEPHEAIAASLFVVGTTSLMGTWGHARADNVAWREGLLFSVGGMSGAFAGGKLGSMIPGVVLLLLFAVMMLVTAVAMLRGRRGEENVKGTPRPFPLLFAEGLVVGGFTGMVGAGGGFLVVPALVLLTRLPVKRAIGTSLLVIALKSYAGLLGYLGDVAFPWRIALMVTAAAVCGSIVGARLAHFVSAARLRSAFAVFVLIMGLLILARELPAAVQTYRDHPPSRIEHSANQRLERVVAAAPLRVTRSDEPGSTGAAAMRQASSLRAGTATGGTRRSSSARIATMV